MGQELTAFVRKHNSGLTSMGFSKHFHSQMIWRHLLINRPLEMATEGRRKGCFVSSPSHSCSHRSSSLRGGRPGPSGAAVTLSPPWEHWPRTGPAWVWPSEGHGRLLCLPWQLPLAEHFAPDCLLQERFLEGWQLASVVFPLLCDVVSSLQGLAEQRRRALGVSRPRMHSQRP